MEPLLPTLLDRPGNNPEPVSLHDRVLTRLIAFSFATVRDRPGGTSFRDAFRAFAEAYFALSLDGEMPFRQPALHDRPVGVLAEAFSDAATSGALAPLPFSPRLVAALVLTSLAVLRRQVHEGALTPTDATHLLTTTFVDGLQASPSPSR